MNAMRRFCFKVSIHVYGALLFLYPREFRARFRAQMVGAFSDACHEQVADKGLARGALLAATLWARELLGLARTSAHERLRSWRQGRAGSQQGHAHGRPEPEKPLGPSWRGRLFDSLAADIRFSLRGLRRNPGFTAVVVVTLALGIGANTAIFSVLQTVLLRPFPFPDPDRLVNVWTPQVGYSYNPLSAADWVDYRESTQSFEALGAYERQRVNLSGDGDPERVSGIRCTAELLLALDVAPAHGRTFRAEETEDPVAQVAIVSDRLWKNRFGADPSLVGREITVNRERLTVIGILPDSFRFPGWQSLTEPDILIPLALEGQIADRGSYYLSAIGRLRGGVSLGGAEEELRAIAARLEQAYPDTNHGRTAQVVGFLLLIACTNVAGLLMSRNAGRDVEMAVRASMGAGRYRLVRQMLTESLILAMIGGAAALLLAWWAIGLLRAIIPGNIPRVEHLSIDLPVVVFSLGAALLTGVLFGIVPALQTSGLDLSRTFRGGATTMTTRRAQTRLLRAVLIAQFALTFVLTCGAGLMLQSLWNATGFSELQEPDQVLIASYSRITGSREEIILADPFLDQLLERLRGIPGVRQVGASTRLPLQSGWTANVLPQGHTYDPQDSDLPPSYIVCASPGYFGAMGIDLLQGRDLLPQDLSEGSLGIVVNRTFAEQFWPGQSPLGKRAQGGFSSEPWFDGVVVGVVEDVRQMSLEGETGAEVYLPFFPGFQESRRIAIRAEGNPMDLVALVRAELSELDPHQPLAQVFTAADLYDGALDPADRAVRHRRPLPGFGGDLRRHGLLGQAEKPRGRHPHRDGSRP